MDPAATYDIETEAWTTFVEGAIHYRSGETRVYRWNDRDGAARMAADLLAIEGEVYAHNGSRFDHLWLMDECGEPATVIPSSSGIVQLTFEGSRAVFCDSMKIFPFSLEKLTGGKKKSIAHLCRYTRTPEHLDRETGKYDVNCGGYCAIRRAGMTPREAREVEKYLVADVEELMSALLHMRDRAAEWGITVRKTVGSTAWKSAESELGIEPVCWPEGAWQTARDGYHGGRSEVFHVAAPKGWQCDVNSMYAWAITQPLPVGIPIVKEGKSAQTAWVRQKPGVYHATVRVPETWIPPLPVRLKTGLEFPWGRFSGAWPRPELEEAVRHGCEVERVHRAVVYQDEREIFTPWVRKLWGERAKYGKESPEGRWLKWLLNSVTGKCGSRCESRRLKVWPDFDKITFCKCPDFATECQCGGWFPLDATDGVGKVWEQVVKNRRPDRCSRPEWASYLTGYARPKLNAKLTESDDAIYCDTDGVKSFSKRLGLGTDLGEWADEGPMREFEARGPKSYRLLTRIDDEWKEVVKMKGVPRPVWKEIVQGLPQKFWSMRGLKRAKGGDFFVRDEYARTSKGYTGRRKLGKSGDTRTYPFRLDE